MERGDTSSINIPSSIFSVQGPKNRLLFDPPPRLSTTFQPNLRSVPAAPPALTTTTTELVTPVARSVVTTSCQLAGARGTHFGLYLVALAATIPRSQRVLARERIRLAASQPAGTRARARRPCLETSQLGQEQTRPSPS